MRQELNLVQQREQEMLEVLLVRVLQLKIVATTSRLKGAVVQIHLLQGIEIAEVILQSLELIEVIVPQPNRIEVTHLQVGVILLLVVLQEAVRVHEALLVVQAEEEEVTNKNGFEILDY